MIHSPIPSANQPPPQSPAPRARARPDDRRRPLRRDIELPLWAKALFLVVGWLLVVLGIAGLFLPVLQGFLLLIPGLAILSLVSDRLHSFLRARFRRWPRGWRRMQKFRRRVERRFARPRR
jgi:hypothetical protein